jgi:ABC-2 type transport system permease protein
MTETRAAGAIYDLGYQRYDGERLGRAHAMGSLIAFSFRTAFGLGRGTASKIVPAIVAGVILVPALVQVGVASASGMPGFINYANHLRMTAFLLALFTAAQVPELIVTDRQHGVLSLYLSRPLSGVNYAVSKLTALVAAMLVLTLGPQLILFVGRVMIEESVWTAFRSEWTKLGPIVGGTFVTSLFLASIGLALGCLASRRAYATASIIAVFLFLPAAAEVVHGISSGAVRRYTVLANPIYLVTGFAEWLFDVQAKRRTAIARANLPGEVYLYVMLGVCAVCLAVLIMKYRKSEP